LGRLLRPLRHGQHEVRPRRSAVPRRTRPAPAQPAGRPRHANPGLTPTRRPGGGSGGALPVVWVIVIVLAGLLLGFLARQRWHRRGDRTEVPENTPVPVPLPEGAGGPAAPPTEDQDAPQ